MPRVNLDKRGPCLEFIIHPWIYERRVYQKGKINMKSVIYIYIYIYILRKEQNVKVKRVCKDVSVSGKRVEII
jgi:hypothetical protein